MARIIYMRIHLISITHSVVLRQHHAGHLLTPFRKSLLWAATIFTSRAFVSTHILPNQETLPILFPVVDILNHAVGAKVEWDFEPHKSFTLKCLDGIACEPGQELFNNYAPKQNDELLLGYGFCLENNAIEQFPLRLAFPPMLRQYATEAGLLEADSVPFGMPPDFLLTDANTEQHFLRAKDHPFGRYQNNVPTFRGIPPYIVHFFFVQAIMRLEQDVRFVNMEEPGVRITLQVLVLLHQALQQRCKSLPLQLGKIPGNDKQRYAKIYRDGQAKIIHSVQEELKVAIDRIRVLPNEMPPFRTALISIHDCINALDAVSPHEASIFQAGIAGYGPSVESSALWTMMLINLVGLRLTGRVPEASVISSWLHALFSKYALPALEDGIEDIETYDFVDKRCGDFFLFPDAGKDVSPIEYLDDLGLTFINQPAKGAESVFIKGRTENLGVRLIMWAMKVYEHEVLLISQSEQVGEDFLFVQPASIDGVLTKDEWIFREV